MTAGLAPLPPKFIADAITVAGDAKLGRHGTIALLRLARGALRETANGNDVSEAISEFLETVSDTPFDAGEKLHCFLIAQFPASNPEARDPLHDWQKRADLR